MRVIRRVYNYTFAFQSCDLEVPAVGTGSTSIFNIMVYINIVMRIKSQGRVRVSNVNTTSLLARPQIM